MYRSFSPSRRSFLGSLGAFALLPAPPTEPETVLFNGNIRTVDARNPRAQAVAIAGGRFVAVGANDEVRRLATARTRAIDLEGKTVVPGFIDAHTHPASSGRRHLREVDCDLRSIAEIQAAIRRRAAETPRGQWVLGFKYDDTKTAEGRPLNRRDLDAAAPDHPVYINHRGGHGSYVNSLALEKADVNDKTPDPPGGHFDRDPATGRLTGHVRERATAPFTKVIPSRFTRADYREGVKLISRMMTRTDSKGNVWGPRQRVTVEEAIRAGTLHGAYASFEENLKGSIEPGKLADLIVLGRDPAREDPMSLIKIPVERTMVGGRWVFEA